MRLLPALALSASACAQAAGFVLWKPDEAQIAKLEARLVLPEGAAPLSAYERYYAGVPPKGSRRIKGKLLLGSSPVRGVHLLEHPDLLPGVHDGGCRVVSLTYDLAADAITEIACNGVG